MIQRLSTTSIASSTDEVAYYPLDSSISKRPEKAKNFKVVIRIRPPIEREILNEFVNVVYIDKSQNEITISNDIGDVNSKVQSSTYVAHKFSFDQVYDQRSTQEEIYDTTAKQLVDSSLLGYNATIFAYGQTSAGKTHTMEGFDYLKYPEARGIIPRSIDHIFQYIQSNAGPRMRFLVRASYLQIYNDNISDLLKPERSNLSVREDKKRGIYVEGLSEWVVRSPGEVYKLIQRGRSTRNIGETKMNEVSSRSHAIFIIVVEQSEIHFVNSNGDEIDYDQFQNLIHQNEVDENSNQVEKYVRQTFKIGKLNLVDLAGSERVRLSGATGLRLEESKQINKSLAALGNVISALTETKPRSHIPYRDSKLTRVLEDSLGGNCKTVMIGMISPAYESIGESLSTLKFATRAKYIRNEARINEDLDQKSLLIKYERELKQLRAELEERNKNVVDKQRLLEVDELRRRAEADKMAAIQALEERSLEFQREKEEKKRLEERISRLMNQVIRGDSPTRYVDTESIDISGEGVLSTEQTDKLRQDYAIKLSELERERISIEEEKAQVDRYKQLLIKQRDIMIALTQRLVERDEQIIALQEEVELYAAERKVMQEQLEDKLAAEGKMEGISFQMNKESQEKRDQEGQTENVDNKEFEGIGNKAIEKNEVYGNNIPLDLMNQLNEVQKQNDHLRKERAAIHIIMENKIAVLVSSIAASANDLMPSLTDENRPRIISLSKDVLSLKKLVNASVNALKNQSHSN